MVDTLADEAEGGGPSKRRRVLVGLGGVAVAAAAVGGVVVARAPRHGTALPEGERLRLLEEAGLPPDFPVHPFAQRAPQPPQGGFSYTLDEPVPDVLAWQRQSLARSGYSVFDSDVPGQDEFIPHWLFFHSGGGAAGQAASGAIIIRPFGRGLERGTEVKVLSRGDQRLVPPTPPAGADRR